MKTVGILIVFVASRCLAGAPDPSWGDPQHPVSIDAGRRLRIADLADEAARSIAMGEDVEYIRSLLRAGLSPNARIADGTSDHKRPLLCLATMEQRLGVMELLLRQPVLTGAFDDEVGRTALQHASADGFCEGIRLLLKHGANVNARGRGGVTALMVAGQYLRLEAAQLLLAAGANVRAETWGGSTALEYTLLQGDMFFPCAREGDLEMVKLLVSHGAEVNHRDPRGGTPLMYAAAGAYRECPLSSVRFLLEKGARVNVKDGRGRTALMLACGTQNAEAVRLLLDWGAEIHARSHAGVAPLMCAVEQAYEGGPLEMVQLLVNRGAEINVKDRRGKTPLMLAAAEKNPDLVQYLLERGADPNARCREGRTPLMIAVETKKAKTVTVILRWKPALEVEDRHGKTALALAQAAGLEGIADLLRAAGAKR